MADLLSAIRQVDSFALLPSGWDYGRGQASALATCARARSVLSTLYALGLRRFNVAPGVEGGVTVAGIQAAGNEIEIQCRVHETYDFYATSGGTEIFDKERLGFTKLLELLRGISWLSMKSSTWFTPNVICLTWDDFQASHLKTHQMALGYRFSVLNVPFETAGTFARIYSSTPDQTFVANHPFSGDSIIPLLQTA